jgi:ATP-binding protein involved in chromosome partitioning
MAEITESAVRKLLETVMDPATGRSVVALGMVGGIATRGGHVAITLDVDPARGTALEPLRQACEQAVRTMPGVLSATAVMTSERPAPPLPSAPAAHDHGAEAHRAHGHGTPGGKTTGGGGRIDVPGVKHIIAVASGKGGVGKSTTAVNLALGLHAIGVRTGLLDADIYGPSIPMMFNVGDERPKSAGGQNFFPIEKYGVKLISIGFFLGEKAPVIWRGPMVMGAVRQFLKDTLWGSQDYLVVDLPPGTGDAQLTLAQQVSLDGAVIVTTPQDVALLDATRAIKMFRQVHCPILGVVENMSYFVCPDCGERDEIFGYGGGERMAQSEGTHLLARIPVYPEVREAGDAGMPIVMAKPAHPSSEAFMELARRVVDASAE